jgi:hypothetical protein
MITIDFQTAIMGGSLLWLSGAFGGAATLLALGLGAAAKRPVPEPPDEDDGLGRVVPVDCRRRREESLTDQSLVTSTPTPGGQP